MGEFIRSPTCNQVLSTYNISHMINFTRLSLFLSIFCLRTGRAWERGYHSVPLAIMAMMTGKENMHLGLEFYRVWSFLFTVELFILYSLNCKFHNYAWSQILAYVNLHNVHFTLVDAKKVQGLHGNKIERQSIRIEQ